MIKGRLTQGNRLRRFLRLYLNVSKGSLPFLVGGELLPICTFPGGPEVSTILQNEHRGKGKGFVWRISLIVFYNQIKNL